MQMMNKDHPMAEDKERDPTSEEFEEAVTYLLNHPQKKVILTMVLKLHIKSRRKYEALVWAVKTVTTMTSRILDQLREDPAEFRPRGAIACVHQLLYEQQQKDSTASPVRHLGEIIRKHHGYHPEVHELGSQISASLRDGVFRACALMILRWYAQSIEALFVSDDEKELDDEAFVQSLQSSMIHPEEVHRVWAINQQSYMEAAAVLVPFGRHRGKKLGETGDRELTWLQVRLLPEEHVEFLIEAVEARLYPNPDDTARYREAGRVEHPWKVRTSGQRAVRVIPIDQQTVVSTKQRSLLSELSEGELDKLHDELLDMRTFARYYAKIEAAVKLLLETEFHRFPFVAPFYDEEAQREKERKHTQTLKRLWTPFPAKSKAVDQYTHVDLERLERDARDELLRMEQDLVEPKTHTIHFTRSIHPAPDGIDQRGYAILYDPETLRYELIIELYGRYPPASAAKQTQAEVPKNRFFVNYPDYPYTDLKQSPRLSFGLECGYDYQDQQFLRAAIGHGDDSDEPRPKLTDAKIVSELNKDGQRDFYIHIPVEIPVSPLGLYPTTILAFHHHHDGYSYTLATLDGMSIEVGDLAIPVHVQRRNIYVPFSKNYVYEVVHAMLDLAYSYVTKGHIPLIAVENTLWKKQATLSRRRNQQVFSHPTGEIMDALQDKAVLQGYMKPLIVGGISPVRQCGWCNHVCPEGQDNTFKAPITACPACDSTYLESDESQQQLHCRSCQRNWLNEEMMFSCDACGKLGLARHNTARATARQARSTTYWLYKYLKQTRVRK
jgi:hypothetical protein